MFWYDHPNELDLEVVEVVVAGAGVNFLVL